MDIFYAMDQINILTIGTILVKYKYFTFGLKLKTCSL